MLDSARVMVPFPRKTRSSLFSLDEDGALIELFDYLIHNAHLRFIKIKKLENKAVSRFLPLIIKVGALPVVGETVRMFQGDGASFSPPPRWKSTRCRYPYR